MIINSDKVNFSQEPVNRSTLIAFIAFWLGLSIFAFSYSFHREARLIFLITWFFQFVGLAMMVSAATFVSSWKFDNIYIKFIWILTLGWYLFIVLRGFTFSFDFFNFLIFNPLFGIFIYLVPVIFLFPKKIVYLKALFSAISLMGILYLLNNLLFFQITVLGGGGKNTAQFAVEFMSHFLAIPSGFILLTYMYHSRWRNLLALAVVFAVFLIATINGRRGLMFISASIMVASYLVFIATNKGKPLNIILSVFLVFFLAIFARDAYIQRQDDAFRRINERLFERTRTGVEEFFYRDMGPVDWVIGRGIDGKYYCPGIEMTEGHFTIYRSVIETGYLQFVLKGGLIYLALFLLVMIPAAFKGLFLSKNLLSKAFAIWIILYLMFTYPTVINSFTPNYIIMWLAAAFCFSKSMREKTNGQIINELSISYHDAINGRK